MNHDLSDRQLAFGYWYLLHKEGVKRTIIGVVIAINFVLYAFSLWRILDLYVFSYRAYEQMLATMHIDLVNLHAFAEAQAPRPLQIIGLSVFPLGKERYDIAAKVFNPNSLWALEVSYRFLEAGFVGSTRSDFILPGEEKFFLDLQTGSKRALTNPQIEFLSTRWRRVSQYASLREKALKFSFNDAVFVPSYSKELGGKDPISKVQFTVRNLSSFNYAQAKLVILLYSGTRIVGVNSLTLERFLSGEERKISQNWFGIPPSVTRVEIQPDINILDKSNFLEFKGTSDF
ncbi:MAG: hypothetical protein HY453_01825 [Parcubacteria group bacterium]|nr:hypothetical protein [Parcubacteria group bacterium]